MIKSFRHKGLKRFYESGSTAGIQPQHAKRLRMQLAALDTAAVIEDMDLPGSAASTQGTGEGAVVHLD